MKAKKNPIEVQGMINSHRRDSVALIRFLATLEKEVRKRHVGLFDECMQETRWSIRRMHARDTVVGSANPNGIRRIDRNLQMGSANPIHRLQNDIGTHKPFHSQNLELEYYCFFFFYYYY